MSSVDGSVTNEKVPTTPYPLVFLRCRTIAFCAITFFSFAWVVLLSIVVFLQWEFMDRSYQSTLMVMISVYAITVVLLLVMLTRRFRAWLDAARFFLLLVVHVGVSTVFAHYSRRFSCPQPTVEDRNVCRVLILYILISSWLLPLLIAIYAAALGVMALYRWHLARPSNTGRSFDLEKDSLDLKLDLKHKSQVSSFLIGPPPSPTPIAARFSTQLDIPNRFAVMPTPTTVDFSGSSYYLASPVHATHASPVTTPRSMAFPTNSQPYLVPTPPNGSPTQLPYLMPPSPNDPGPQPYSTTPGNPQPYSTPPSNPQSYSAPSRNPYLASPSNPSVQSYLAAPSHPQPYLVPPGNPYLTPSSSNRQSYSTLSSHPQPLSPPLHNPYLMPPLPPHWNSNPPPTRSRHYSVTTLHESIPEETSSTSSWDPDYRKRASARLSKPSRSSRLPSL